MKKNIHPEIHEVTAHCACGNSFSTISTSPDIRVTICSNCHPFFTGAQRFVDTAGRIEKWEKKYAKNNEAEKGKAKQTPAAQPKAKTTTKSKTTK